LRLEVGLEEYRPDDVTEQRRLNSAEREEISRGVAAGESGASIAARLGRDPSVVNREIALHGGRAAYRATVAAGKALKRRRRSNKIETVAELRADVVDLLRRGASPRQIECALRRAHPENPDRRVSHETIYDFIYVHAKGALRKELISLLRRKKPRRSPAPRARSALSGRLPGAIPIADRPEEVEGRRVPGHWEADLIMGAGNRSALLVLVERVSRYVMIIRLKEKDAHSVRLELQRAVSRLPDHLRRTLTYDNGKEMAEHIAFTVATKMPVYFCNPHSPWQRGSVENTNGLIREYFPKGTDFKSAFPSAVRKAEWNLNNRPRVALHGQTPAELFLSYMNTGCAVSA
jgi:transposase, IS30 family